MEKKWCEREKKETWHYVEGDCAECSYKKLKKKDKRLR